MSADNVNIEQAEKTAGAHIHECRTNAVHNDKVGNSTTRMAEKMGEFSDVISAYNKAVGKYNYEIEGEEYEDIRVHFDLGGRQRTASLSNIDRFSVIEDFPETIYNNGRYNKDKLIEHMIETAVAYKEKMVFTADIED